MEERCWDSVFSPLKAALWGNDKFPLQLSDQMDWEAVLKELKDQTVDILAVDVIGTVPGLKPQLKQELIVRTVQSVSFWNKLMKEQQELYWLLREAGLHCAVMKGAGAAVSYPRPEYRRMGDVDLIVLPEEFEQAFRLMRENGYELVHDDGKRHAALKKNGILFELHRWFSTLTDPEAARILDDIVYKGAFSASEETLQGYAFPKLPDLANGLVLLAHIDQHLTSGLGLRQIIDWMLFVDRKLDDEWWRTEFGEWVRRLGMEKLAVTVTRMCQIYLGLREDGVSWCLGAEEDLCEELMRVTLERGNFGRKRLLSSRTIRVLNAFSEKKTLGAILKKLQEHGLHNWKAAKQYPVLRPFAWLYQICRYLRKGFSRKNPFSSLASDAKKSKQEKLIWERLELSFREWEK